MNFFANLKFMFVSFFFHSTELAPNNNEFTLKKVSATGSPQTNNVFKIEITKRLKNLTKESIVDLINSSFGITNEDIKLLETIYDDFEYINEFINEIIEISIGSHQELELKIISLVSSFNQLRMENYSEKKMVFSPLAAYVKKFFPFYQKLREIQDPEAKEKETNSDAGAKSRENSSASNDVAIDIEPHKFHCLDNDATVNSRGNGSATNDVAIDIVPHKAPSLEDISQEFGALDR